MGPFLPVKTVSALVKRWYGPDIPGVINRALSRVHEEMDLCRTAPNAIQFRALSLRASPQTGAAIRFL